MPTFLVQTGIANILKDIPYLIIKAVIVIIDIKQLMINHNT